MMATFPRAQAVLGLAYMVPRILDFTLALIKHKDLQRRAEAAEQIRKLEAENEQERNRQAAEQTRKQEAADEQERNRQAAKEIRRQEAADGQERNRQATEHSEMFKKFEEERNREKAEYEQKMQTLQELINELTQQTHAQIGRDRETVKEIKQLKERIEHEKRERQEAIRMQDIKFKSLVQTIVNAFKLFMNYYHQYQQQSSPMEYGMHHSRSQLRASEYQERVRLLANFGLPEDSDKDLHDIFVKSCLLEDNRGRYFEAGESSTHPNFARNISISELPAGFEDDNILSMVMTTLNDAGNPQVTNLLALNHQVFGGSEDDISSSVMTSINNGIRAKEEGDAYFKKQKFEEAIKCYSQSIDELPTAAAYADRAMTYIKLNRFTEAEYDCTDALEIDDRYFKAYARRAMARTKLRFNLAGALKDVQVALKLETNTEEIKELCAQLMPLEGKLGGDAQEMEIRVQLMSWKAATEAKEEGNHYFKDKKFEEAIISYSVSINKSPTAAAYNNRAMAYIKLNKMMEAEKDCTKVLEIDNQSFKAYARRAIAREKLGDNIKGALEDVEAALKLEPDSREMEQLHGKLILDEYILSNN